MTRTAVGVSLTLAVTVPLALPTQAQTGSRLWRQDERVLVTDMSLVEAVAADENVLYVVSPAGIGVYDRRFGRWQPPVTVLDGYAHAPVLSALVDPTDQSVWLGTVAGVVNYSPRMRLYQTAAVSDGAVQLMFDRDDAFSGIYLRNRLGWHFLPRGGVIARPVASLPPAHRQVRTVSVQEVVSRHPEIETMRLGPLLDDRMRSYRYTSAAEVAIAGEVFLGTNGRGVIRYDTGIATFEPLPFGLLAPRASSVTVVPDGVWVGSDGRSGRSGFTWVSSDLQRFEFEEGPRIAGLAMGTVHQVTLHQGDLWAATEAGVTIASHGSSQRLTTVQGLPSDRALSLAGGPDGIWVGTQRGLAFVGNDGVARRVGTRLFEPVRALAGNGDSVWVGSRAGLGLSWTGVDRVVVPPDVAQVPELAQEIVALTLSDSVLVVGLRDRLVWRSVVADSRAPTDDSRVPIAGGWQVERTIPEIGELTSLAADGDAVWIGGSRGFAHYRPATRSFVFHAAPGDVPGVVWDLAVDERYLWLATDGGLVRVLKRAVVP
jgi:ligand-binding sensor domain-containing protein